MKKSQARNDQQNNMENQHTTTEKMHTVSETKPHKCVGKQRILRLHFQFPRRGQLVGTSWDADGDHASAEKQWAKQQKQRDNAKKI